MKNSIFLILILLFQWGCSSDKLEKIDEVAFIKLEQDTLLFDARAQSRLLSFQTNNSKELQIKSADSSWCVGTLSGSLKIQTKIAANSNLKERWTKITVFNKDLQKELTIGQQGTAPSILLSPEKWDNITYDSITLKIKVVANVDFDILLPEENTWVTVVSKTDTLVMLRIDANVLQTPRSMTLVFQESNGGDVKRELILNQKAYSYEPSKPEGLESDKQVMVSSGKASSFQPGSNIDKSYDGDRNTIYHSNWTNSASNYFPITLDYYFTDNQSKINYLVYYPRPSGSNGNFKEIEVWYQRAGDESYIKYGDFNCGGTNTPTLIYFKNIESANQDGDKINGLVNPKGIRFVVKSGSGDGNGFAACGEMEFYESTEMIDVFTDGSCSALKKGVTLDQIASIENDFVRKLATALYHNLYPKEYRVTQYNAILNPSVLGQQLRIGDGFSRYQGITGMYLEKGEHIVFVGDMHGKSISLLIPNWMRQPPAGVDADKDPAGWGLYKQTIALKEGINIINVTTSSNAYVSYYDADPENCRPITVHFATGKINGYFDPSKHTNADWDNLLKNAPSPIMDAIGQYIQVAYPVARFKEFASGKGVELIKNYDTMLGNMYQLMGLKKYNRLPSNRILSRVNFNYYMFRDGDGVAYLGNTSTMGMVVNPDRVIVGDPCWGFSHEAGHVLQMRPQLTWGGMTEVSNNIYSLYSTTYFGNESRLSTSYAAARNEIVNANPKISYLQHSNVFYRLVPFWQLHLYFSKNGFPDFYPDVMEAMRTRSHAGTGNNSIRNQFEFIKICCDVTGKDLTDFFQKWGFFWVGTISLNDYGDYVMTVTDEMVAETKAYISQYPAMDVDLTMVED